MTINKQFALAVSIFLMMFLTACGGGSGDASNTSPNGNGNGGNTILQLPPIPTNVSVLGLDGAILIEWDTPATNVPHNLYWSVDGGPEDVIENISPPYFHQGLINGSLYTYRLTATNAAGESPRTAPVTSMPVTFNWQENWTIPADQGNNPQCNDDGATSQCIIISQQNAWYTSRFHSGSETNATLNGPLNYIKLFKNFNMTSNGVVYTMNSEAGMNMTVEQLQESSLEARNLNIPVQTYTELFVSAFEAVLPGTFEYAYLEINPVTFIPGNPCNGINLRYIFGTASDQAIPNILPDNSIKIIEIGTIDTIYRRNILLDLTCGDAEYAVGTVKLGIEGIQSDNNWIRWEAIGIIGPPLP